MKIKLEIMFENCKEEYSETLVAKFNLVVEKEFGEHFDIQHSLRLESGKVFAYIGLSRNYITRDTVGKIISLTKKTYSLIKPNRVIGDYEPEIDALTRKEGALFWLNVFNSDSVKEIGKDKLLSAPIYKIEELEDGAVLMILNDDPWLCGPEIREKIRRHLFE